MFNKQLVNVLQNLPELVIKYFAGGGLQNLPFFIGNGAIVHLKNKIFMNNQLESVLQSLPESVRN